MSGNVRYWILVLSVLVIVQLLGNLLLFNVLLVYPHANHLLPEQYKVNSTIEEVKNVGKIQKRSIEAKSGQEFKINAPQETTVHPITVNGPFLETSPTKPPRTRRTRRPSKTKGPATILTNPNVPPETTTFIQRISTQENNTLFNNSEIEDFGKLLLKNSEDLSLANSTETVKPTLFNRDWLQFLQEAFLFSSAGLGMLVGYAPLSIVLRKNGSRMVIGTLLAFSAFFIVVQMKLISFGAIYVCVLRFFHGLTCAPILAFIGTNSAQWATLKEQLTFLTASFSAILFAPAFSWFLVYKVIDAEQLIQLQILHYSLAGFTILLALSWILFYRDSPQQHKFVNGVELNKIATGKAQNNRLMERSVFPLLLKSVSMWSLTIASFGYFSAFAIMANFLPVYLVTVLKVNLCTMTSLTFVIAILCHIFCFVFNKLLCGCSSSLKIRSFNTFGFVMTSALFILIAALPPDSNFVETTRILLLLVLLPLGFTTLGFIYSSVIYGRFFTQYIVTNMQAPFALSMTIIPLFVVFMTADNVLRSWRLVYLVIGAVLLLCSVIFGILIRGQPASWAEHSWDPSSSYKMRNVEYAKQTEECGLLELRRLDGVVDDHINQY